MNPKKRIMEYLSRPPCGHPAGATCDACDQVRRIMDGMSAGTASLVIENAANAKWDDDYVVADLANQGRYYTASIINCESQAYSFYFLNRTVLYLDKRFGNRIRD
jgi:hypothetical protein